MADLNDLALFCDGFAKSIPSQINELSKKVILTVLIDLVWSTPVDTSNALSNWQITLDNPAIDEIPPYFLGEKGSTRKQSGAEAIQEGSRVLLDKKPGQVVYITDNAPYIQKLNEGSSPQQIAGFIERSIVLSSVVIGNFKLIK